MRRAIRARRWLAGIARSTAVLPDFESAHCIDVTTTVVRPVRPLSCVFLRPRQSRRRGVRHDLRFAPPTPPPAGNDGTPYYTEPAHATLSAAGTARRGADESTTRGARSVVGVCPPHGASRRLISTEGTCPHPTHPAPHRPPQDRMWCKSLRQRSWSARQTSGGFPRPQPPRLRPALRRGRQILSPFCRAQVTPQGVITAPAWRISVPGLSPGSAPEPPPTESSYARPQSRLAALMQAGERWGAAGGGRGRLLLTPHDTHAKRAMRHVPYIPRMASTRAGKARGRWLRCSSPPPRARLRPWLAALMRAGGVRGRLLCARDPTRNCQPRRGTCRTAPAWPLLALARREGAGFVVHRHLPVHDRGPGWRRSCRLGVCGGGSGAFWSGASAQATPGTCPTPPSCP